MSKGSTVESKAYAKAYRLANREKGIATSRAWRLANPERAIASQKAWHERNKEKRDATNKAWRLANPEKHKATSRSCTKKYRSANPEISKVHCRTRRARRLSVQSEPYTTQDILDLWGSDCWICGGAVDLSAPRRTGLVGWERGLHLDHVIPLARGGSNLMLNVKPSHGLCNLIKKR